MHAMVRRIGASAAAAQLQLIARRACQKWSPAQNCRPITSWSDTAVGPRSRLGNGYGCMGTAPINDSESNGPLLDVLGLEA
eukprot:SAG31_NODE_10234_length_1166_cov_1.928772_1_plen_81_part_00